MKVSVLAGAGVAGLRAFAHDGEIGAGAEPI
jgi:hypothetical protein